MVRMSCSFALPSTIITLADADISIDPDRGEVPSVIDQQNATGDSRGGWKTTVSATAKLLLCTVRDSADAFPPLKSVAGGLCFILENYEVRFTSTSLEPQCLQLFQRSQGNKQTIESVAPRVKSLAESLCAPVFEGDAKEKIRRRILEE